MRSAEFSLVPLLLAPDGGEGELKSGQNIEGVAVQCRTDNHYLYYYLYHPGYATDCK